MTFISIINSDNSKYESLPLASPPILQQQQQNELSSSSSSSSSPLASPPLKNEEDTSNNNENQDDQVIITTITKSLSSQSLNDEKEINSKESIENNNDNEQYTTTTTTTTTTTIFKDDDNNDENQQQVTTIIKDCNNTNNNPNNYITEINDNEEDDNNFIIPSPLHPNNSIDSSLNNNNNNNNDNNNDSSSRSINDDDDIIKTTTTTTTTTTTIDKEEDEIKEEKIIDGEKNDQYQSTERYIEDLNDFVKISPYIEDDEEFQEIKSLLNTDGTNSVSTTTTTTTTTTTPTSSSTTKSTVTNLFSKAANTFTSINNFIKYSIISEETEEALGHINSLLNQLFKNVPYSKLQIMLGLSLLDSYYSNSHITTGSFVNDKEFIERAGYYMKFASATFGWKYIYGYLYKKKGKGFVQGVVQGDALNDQVLCEYTGIAKEDIILTKWVSTNFDPGHYLCFDHKNKSVIFSIRGTFGARDILTDLVANQTSFLEGKAHTGMLRCAQKKFDEITPIILESLKKFNPNNNKKDGNGGDGKVKLEIDEDSGEIKYHSDGDYSLIVVGHSLGAGVASLFTILFKHSYPDIPIHCYSFATPCVTSSELALSIEYRPLIDTFVFNDDIVPRLCYASLEHLKTLVCSILEQNDSVFNLIFQTISAGNQLGEGLTNKMDSFLKYKRDIKLKYEELKLTGDSMLPPGKVYRIYKPDVNVNYVMEESNPSFFKEIIISNTLISDHMPDKYEMAFQLCVDNLNSINPFIDLDKEDLVILNNNDDLENDIENQLGKQIHNFEKELFNNPTTININDINNNNKEINK